MNGKKWESLDFNFGSDYNQGTPEMLKALLRQFIGVPINLPGESDVHKTKRHKKTNSPKISFRGYLQSSLSKGKR
jgi:hypothetical protein